MDSLGFSNPQLSINRPDSKDSSMLKTENLVFAWGKNKDGELSLGHTKAVNVPKPVRGLKNQIIKDISPGGQHTSLVTSEGLIMVCGSSLHGKLGIEELNVTSINKFQVVPALKSMRSRLVVSGDYHTLCALENGEVYAWGGNLHKKLGQKAGRPGQVSMLSTKRVVFVDCGDFHSAALTDQGELYTWGGGGSHFNKGQLGQGHLNDVDKPEVVPFLRGKVVKKISCGGYHMMALTETDDLYSWGSGTYGECGFGEFIDAHTPKKVNLGAAESKTFKNLFANSEDYYFTDDYGIKPKVIDIACGGHHSLVLTNKGHVYSCGYGSHGQLGLKSTSNFADLQLVYTLTNKNVIQIAAGWNHSLVLTDRHDLYSCGYGSSGQLGLGDDESKTLFTHVTAMGGKNISKIFAGGNHSWAILDDNNPINYSYQPPSPLRSPVSTPFNGKSRDVSPDPSFMKFPQEKNSFSNLDLYEKADIGGMERAIQICYSEVEMSHRFARFFVPTSQNEIFNTKVEEYLKEIYSFEPGTQYHTLREDQEIIEEKEEDIRYIKVESSSNGKSYTLMMVCDLNKNPALFSDSVKKPIMSERFQTIPCVVGEMIVLRESDVTRDESQKKLCKWMLIFLKKFGSYAMNLKFFELRPQSMV